MSETGAGPTIQEVEAPGRNLHTKTEVRQVLGSLNQNLIEPAVAPAGDDAGEPTVGIFSETWQQDERFKDMPSDLLEDLAHRRETVVNAVIAGQQAVNPEKDTLYPEAKFDIKTLQFVRDKDGSPIPGQLRFGDLVFACEEIASQAEKSGREDLKETAEKAAAFLKDSLDVAVQDQTLTFEAYEQALAKKAASLEGITIADFGNLPEGIRMARLAQAEKELNPKYTLVCAKEPEATPAQVEDQPEQQISDKEIQQFETEGNLLKVMGIDPEKISLEDKKELDRLLAVDDASKLSEKEVKQRQKKITAIAARSEKASLDDQLDATTFLFKKIFNHDVPVGTTLEQVRSLILNFYGINTEDPDSLKDKLKNKSPLLMKLLMALFLAATAIAPAAEQAINDQIKQT
ncbi:hypothetical protein A3J78_01180 [Candidatus Beckwithbacteria bacterium RBG_13_35_6]|uniref:Uncharacterized protein n=1 Tax=Candidatus Beckwithbacteria bacterium RBG_13_35_6 TaxID=1797456 RepID=A0A1F5DCF9_9BACT|nr:MAG: hypothetical protein A3J78_01180 [Candidatus Beckwithbacteria bacterium RBG_13_35_6]